jgi:exo-beta-1,3-glucanase (GH17 family)
MQPSPTRSLPARFWAGFLLLHLLALAGLASFVLGQLKPVELPALHLEQGEKLRCVSYAPYYQPGQTPLELSTRIPREQIVADLKALAPLAECVRIYSVSQGLELVPGIARELGLKVLVGAWIGVDAEMNRTQLDTAVRLANAHPQTVKALIVGNEVLLRREQTEAGLRRYIEETRQRVKVPVTYADVWEFWTRHPDLASAVDFVTVHILPYWEDDPVAVDQALRHIADVRALVARQFSKPILIGETGWPSAGRQREASLPSLVNQARYVREFIRKAHDEGWDYNLIEAVDQPWKRRLEGTVGGYWGILDTSLAPKFSFVASVADRLDGRPVGLAAAAGALAGLLASLIGVIKYPGGPRILPVLAVAASGAVAGAVLMLEWEHAGVAYRDDLEWTVLGAVALGAALLPVLLGLWAGCRPFPGGVEAWRMGRGRSHEAVLCRQLGLLRFALLFAAAVAALLLFADPRYRDFPTLLYAIPALAFAALGLCAPNYNRLGREERVFALVILVGGTGRWLTEPANLQALGWWLCCLLLAAGAALGRSDQHQEGGQSTHR